MSQNIKKLLYWESNTGKTSVNHLTGMRQQVVTIWNYCRKKVGICKLSNSVKQQF
jgi:hypothetical protein